MTVMITVDITTAADTATVPARLLLVLLPVMADATDATDRTPKTLKNRRTDSEALGISVLLFCHVQAKFTCAGHSNHQTVC